MEVRDPTDNVHLRGQLARRLSVLRPLLDSLPLILPALDPFPLPPPPHPFPFLPYSLFLLLIPCLLLFTIVFFAQVEILENRSKCITEYVVNLCPATEEEGSEKQEVSVASSQPDFPVTPAKRV